MGIQEVLDNQLKHKDCPRYVVQIKNETGSLKVPKSVRVTLYECDSVTLEETEEGSEVNFVDCSSVTVSGCTKSILRFSKGSEIQQVTAEDSEVHFGDANVQQIELTRCTGAFINSQIQQGTLEESRFESSKNTFQQLEVTGGKFFSFEDEVQELTVSDKATGRFFKLQAEQATIEESQILLKQSQTQQLEVSDSALTDHKGEHEKFTSSGEKSTVRMRETKLSGETSFEEGSALLSKVECEGELSIEKCSFIGQELKVSSELSAKESKVVLADCEIESEATFEDSATRVRECSFQSEVTVEQGAYESDDSEYQSEFSLKEGTLISRNDTFSSSLSLEDLVHDSQIVHAEGMMEFTATGGGTAGLKMVDCESQMTDISEMGILHCVDSDLGLLKLESVSVAILDECEGEMAEVTDVPFLNAATSTFTMMDLSDVQMALTAETDIVATNCGINDIGSEIAADSCMINCRDSNVIANASLVNNIGGTVEGADVTVITTQGGETINLDGLTMGTGFDPDMQGGSLKFDGIDLTLQSTVGNVDIISRAGDITMTSDIGSIIATAAVIITLDCVLDIELLAGGMANITAGESVDIITGTDITIDAGGAVLVQSVGSTDIASEGVTNVAGASVNIIGVVNIN